jgi:CheY-like chemotaxis protein
MATVLVVDDDRVVSHLVSSLLREKGHKVLTASTPFRV